MEYFLIDYFPITGICLGDDQIYMCLAVGGLRHGSLVEA